LGTEVVVTEGGGYRLAVPPVLVEDRDRGAASGIDGGQWLCHGLRHSGWTWSAVMLVKRGLRYFLVVLLVLGGVSAVATPACAAAPGVRASAIVGLWHNTITCQGLVEAANKTQLRQVARTVVDGYFPSLQPRQPLHGSDICPGKPVGIDHEHFFTSNGFFGSLDNNGDVVDIGTYTILSRSSVFICSELNPPTCASDDFKGTFRFRVSGDHLGLRLDPLITPEQRATALRAPNTFTDVVWMLSVADAGRTWLHRACDFCR
jgi:hypothetical protein